MYYTGLHKYMDIILACFCKNINISIGVRTSFSIINFKKIPLFSAIEENR